VIDIERPEPAAVQAIGVTKAYGRALTAVTALDTVSVAFGRGRLSVVMGPSGSGKSTLLHCLSGLDPVDSGTVRVGEVDLTGLGERQLTRLCRDRIGFIFQSFNLLPTLSAAENIALPLALAGRRPAPAWINQLVDAVGLADRLRHRPGELSGGQQQRVAAARALASRPEVVFADEPTGNLDTRSGAELLAFLRRCVDQFAQTIVMVTHDPIAAGHADEAGDLDHAAELRDAEEQLLTRLTKREREWTAGVDLAAVIQENHILHSEIDRLRELLRQHGIEPNGGTAQNA
jgi:putative ABC transport system ATP-binding protein